MQAAIAMSEPLAATGPWARSSRRGLLLHAIGAITLSALLVALSAPGVGDVSILAWVAFAPWLASLPRLRWHWAALSGLAMGLAYIIPGHWSTFAAAVGNTGAEGWAREALTLAFFSPYALPFLVFGAIDGLLRAWAGANSLTGQALLRSAVLASLICLIWSPFPYTPVTAIVDWSALVQ